MREIGTRLFLQRRGINIQLFALRRRGHGDFERKPPDFLDEKLEEATNPKTKVIYCLTKNSTSFNKIVKQEVQLLTENSSPNIKLWETLKAIPPTSVEAKRAFSAAGLFVTTLGTSINCLCFLKSYFKNE
ncbi:uncharacterized protein TNCV_1288281 [Trichonephila clavipes]|nr:uncharacterized protein TNCV_1288281 [Trichonephila clavipes]